MKETEDSFLTNPPAAPQRVVLWPPRAGSSRYYVLGGQHALAAVLAMRKRLQEQSLPVPEHLSLVLARVLKVDTPLDIRQRVAGDHQAAQSAVHSLPFWRFMSFLAESLQRRPDGDVDSFLIAAIQKSGQPRPTTMEKLREKWYPVLSLAQSLKDQAAVAIRRLEESSPEKITGHTFRQMRMLYTPEHRGLAARALLEPSATTKTFGDAIQRACKAQWIAWHWTEANKKIDADKGVIPFPFFVPLTKCF